MDADTLRRYRTYRAQGMPAKMAYGAVTFRQASPRYDFLADLGDTSEGESITGTVGLFTVTVEIQSDYEARIGEDDVTGSFTDEYEAGCIKNTTGGEYNHLKWYKPSSYTLGDAYNDLRKTGMSKQVARETYAEQVRREMAEDAVREYYGVTVTVEAAGRELASSSLWGVDALARTEALTYIRDVAADLIDEATREAHWKAPDALATIDAEIAALTAQADVLREVIALPGASESTSSVIPLPRSTMPPRMTTQSKLPMS